MSNSIDNNIKGQVHEIRIVQGVMTLGRGKDNTVQFTDNSVSTHHARITTLFNASYIEDLGSTNGTYINGKPVKQHTLHDGDTIMLGEQLIRINKSDAVSVA